MLAVRLDVPLERGGQRLVEVVDVEDQPPVRRGEHAEVQQVRVAAALHPDAGRGRVREVPRHRRRRAAEIGERRGEHAAVPDRHQVGHARGGLLLEDRDRVRPVGRRLPPRVVGAGYLLAPGAPAGLPLLRREYLVRRGEDTWRHFHKPLTPRS
jgi:hypothetical protein